MSATLTGKRIHDKRIECGLTLEELGNRLGVHKTAVRKWEQGEVTNIKRENVEKLASIFNVSPAWLVGYDSLDKHNIAIDIASDEVLRSHLNDQELTKRVVNPLAQQIKEQHKNIPHVKAVSGKLVKQFDDTTMQQYIESLNRAEKERIDYTEQLKRFTAYYELIKATQNVKPENYEKAIKLLQVLSE